MSRAGGRVLCYSPPGQLSRLKGTAGSVLKMNTSRLTLNGVPSVNHSSKTEISTAITLTLLLRSVGAALFGVFADLFGRKYPLTINMWILGALQVASIYAPNWKTFLAVRALFGLGMGGV